MTLKEFYDYMPANKLKFETKDGKTWIVNTITAHKVIWDQEIYDDLVRFHGERAGSDLLNVLVVATKYTSQS